MTRPLDQEQEFSRAIALPIHKYGVPIPLYAALLRAYSGPWPQAILASISLGTTVGSVSVWRHGGSLSIMAIKGPIKSPGDQGDTDRRWLTSRPPVFCVYGERNEMSKIRPMAIGLFIAACTLVGAGPALAARAVVVESTSVRSGPGSNYRSLGRVRSGDRVTINRCSGSRRWCHINSPRTRNGWVRSQALDRIGRGGSNRRGGICFFGRRGEICIR